MNIEQIAVEIKAARETKGLVEPPSRRQPGFSMDDAYAVGRYLYEQRVASGARPVGFKLGFTNRATWETFGLESPFWASIYADTVTTDSQVSLDRFVAPRIEAEIVLGFRSDLTQGASSDEICAAMDWAAPGFEIVQRHYPSWAMTPADALADAGTHGVLVIGRRVPGPVTSEDLAATQVSLCRGDEVVGTGSGANALGSPIEAIRWLLRLPGIEGLAAGSIVTTGTLTTSPLIASGDEWRSEWSGLSLKGAMVVRFY